MAGSRAGSRAIMRTALLMLLVPCLRSLADAGAPHGLQCRLRLRGGGRRAAAGGGVRVRRPDPGACGTIRSSLAEAEDGGPPPAPLPPLSLPPLSR